MTTSQPIVHPNAADLLAEAAADVQYEHTDGVIDLTWGHPDPSALASDAIAEAARSALTTHGWQALTYGAPCGAAFTRAAIASLLTRTDTPVAADEVIVTNNDHGRDVDVSEAIQHTLLYLGFVHSHDRVRRN